jgi:hypothetical protein
LTDDATGPEEVRREPTAHHCLVHVVVERMRAERQPSAHANPEQVLLRRQMRDVTGEILEQRSDAGVPRRRRRSLGLRDDLIELKRSRCVRRGLEDSG